MSAGKRRITVELTARDFRAVLRAFDIARDPTVNAGWRWWIGTPYVSALYWRLRDHAQKVTP